MEETIPKEAWSLPVYSEKEDSMKQLPGILKLVFIIADAALAAAIVLILVFGGRGSSIVGAASANFENNSLEYGTEAQTQTYSGIISAKISTDILDAAEAQAAEEGKPSALTPETIATETPTPTPTTTPAASSDYSTFIFPNSDTTLITTDEMNSLLTDQSRWQRAVNELYARHGYQFHADKNATDYAYFNSLDWYVNMPKVDSQETVKASFNSVEHANLQALVDFASAKGWL